MQQALWQRCFWGSVRPYGKRLDLAPTLKAPYAYGTTTSLLLPTLGGAPVLVAVRAFRLIVKRPRDHSAHSPRSRLVTAAAIGGADERMIMKHTGHRSVQMVRRYMRDANLFRNNPATKAGL